MPQTIKSDVEMEAMAMNPLYHESGGNESEILRTKIYGALLDRLAISLSEVIQVPQILVRFVERLPVGFIHCPGPHILNELDSAQYQGQFFQTGVLGVGEPFLVQIFDQVLSFARGKVGI